MDQALEAAEKAGVKNLVVAPTHLMHGAEYDELTDALKPYESKMNIVVAEPLLGEVGADATVINEDKKIVAEALTAAAVKDAGYADLAAAEADGTAFVFLGHGTSHTANVTYDQMQTQLEQLGYKNAFVGTVEGEPEDTACDKVIDKVKEAGYKKVVLRPMMVVAGDHANNDMADPEDPESWYSMFTAAKAFDKVDCQIAGLGEIPAVQDLYVVHVTDAVGKVA
jgi:cobalamin biosynthesis Co2+ chelatase CbiK